MKSTGIVRKVDALGRVVVPIELRRTLGIKEQDSLEIYADDNKIVLKKYKASMECVVTGEVSDDNHVINGIVLSNEGATVLLNAIQSRLRGK